VIVSSLLTPAMRGQTTTSQARPTVPHFDVVAIREGLRCLAELPHTFVNKQPASLTAFRGGVYKRVKSEVARGAAISVDGCRPVGVSNHEFVCLAISQQARNTRFRFRRHSSVVVRIYLNVRQGIDPGGAVMDIHRSGSEHKQVNCASALENYAQPSFNRENGGWASFCMDAT
jgi:hypothetical protein